MCFGYANATNATAARLKRHMNFVADIKDPMCSMVEYEPIHLRCRYVKETESCRSNLFVINYIEFYYCALQPVHILSVICSIALFVGFCIYLFEILGLTAGEFLTPSLKVLSKIFKLSETVAGDTLLSFCNCAPDVLTNMASITTENSTIYSDVFGSALCAVLIVSGILIAFQPIVVEPFPFVRDVLFLLLDVAFVEFCIEGDLKVTLTESICIILIYFFYIFVVLMDQYLLHQETKKLLKEQNAEDEEKYLKLLNEANLTFVSRGHKGKEQYIVDELDTEFAYYDEENSQNAYILWILMETLRPYDKQAWKHANWFSRIHMASRMPIILMLKIIVPVVDYELPMHGWCKLLNTAHIVIVPTFLTGVIWKFDDLIFGYPVCLYTFAFCIPFAFAVFFTTRTDKPPPYFKYFSVLAIIASAYLTYALAKECVSILDLIGITTHRSSAFVSATLLAFGNCVGGLISNFALLKQGYSKMGLSSCYGGPLLNSLLSLGITYLYQSLNSEDLYAQAGVGTIGAFCTVFLAVSLVFILVAALTTQFILRRSQGIFILLLYLLFFFYCLLSEFEIMHAYGTLHSMDSRPLNVLDY